MPYTKEQQRAYNVKRREERRKKCIELLGGKCVNCGATENLEFDHINPADTVRRISELLTCKMEIILGELGKCQLLCKPCHFEKTTRQDRVHADQTHGTLSSYKYCKCKLCVKAHSKYMQQYKKNNKPFIILHGSFRHYKFCGPPRCNSCRMARRIYEYGRAS